MSRQFGRALDTFVPLREGDEGITAVRMVVVNSDYTSVRLSFAFWRHLSVIAIYRQLSAAFTAW
jgi:predicted DNA-binding ribbon-helix-helix protein